MEKYEDVKIEYYIETVISRGRYLDDKIGVQSGKLDELYIFIADPKQNRHVGQYLINDMKEYAI